MKKIFPYLTALILFCSLSGCSSSEEFVNDAITSNLNHTEYNQYIEQRDDIHARLKSNNILSDYIVLKDSVYFLNITESEAMKLGVPAHHFRLALQDMARGNELLRQALSQGAEVEFKEPSEMRREIEEHKNQRKLRNTESEDSLHSSVIRANRNQGTITTDGMEERRCGGFVTDYSDNRVSMTCWSNVALWPVYVCTMYNAGVVHPQTAMTLKPRCPAKVELGLYLTGSNQGADVGFRTSDCNGGLAWWRVLK